MVPRSRRNACPTVARPMETGDGLLARLPPAGPLSPAALLAVCGAARRFGNGFVEVTARGSIQVRGLSPATAAPFAAALAEAGIVDARPAILHGPLSGLDPEEVADVRPVVRALRRAIDAEGIGARLAPKLSVVVDGGGALHLDAIDADLRLIATGDGRFHLAVGGSASGARPIGPVAAGDVVPTALAALRMIAALGPAARGADLDPAAVGVGIGAERHATAPRRQRPAEPVGDHILRDGSVAVGIGLPFGQTDADTLAALVDAAAARGAAGAVPAPCRALLAVGIAAADAGAFRARAAALGFVVRADDPRRAVVACPGAPACASGRMPARAVAAALAAAAAPMLDGSVTLHVSGCAKGCAHPRPATLTLVGGDRGAGLVVSGRAGDAAARHVPVADLPAAVARLAATAAARRRRGETAAAAVARLGTVAAREAVDA